MCTLIKRMGLHLVDDLHWVSTSDPEGASVRVRRCRTEASCLPWMRWWGRGRDRARARLPSRPVAARPAALAAARTAWAVPSGEITSPRAVELAFPSGLVGDKPAMDVTAEESLGGLAVSKGCSVLGKLRGAGPVAIGAS